MSTFAAIIAAAGRSSRFGSAAPREKKVFRELQGRAVWLRSVEAFIHRDDVKQTLVIVSPEDMEWFQEKFAPNLAFLEVELVEGGEQRADSVQNALARVKSDIDFVSIHDGARPLIANQWIDDVFAAAVETSAATLAIPISSTVKRADGNDIVETVSRDSLYESQTPQVFARELILEAFAKRGEMNATDESSLVEQLGHRVRIVPGSPLNMKITSKDDLRTAEALLSVLPREKGLDKLDAAPKGGLDQLFS